MPRGISRDGIRRGSRIRGAGPGDEPPRLPGESRGRAGGEWKEKRQVRIRGEPEAENSEARGDRGAPGPLERPDEERDAGGEERESEAVTP